MEKQPSAGDRVPRLARDVSRLALAGIAGLNAAIITLVIEALVGHTLLSIDVLITCMFAFSAASSIAYLLHTLLLFGRMAPDRLHAALLASNPSSRSGRIGAIVSGTGPTIAVQWSIIAVAAVLAFTIAPNLLHEVVTVWLSILVVASSWTVTVVAYAVHYARFDAVAGGIDFPGKSPRHFSDYVYLSVQVQTTFSTSDVSLTDPAVRRLVTGHTLVSFAFNTVIIAMLITVLFVGN